MSDQSSLSTLASQVADGHGQVPKLVRRRTDVSSTHDAKELKRRRSGTIVMACIAILLLMHRRLSYDSPIMMAIESGCSLLFVLLAQRFSVGRVSRPVGGSFEPLAQRFSVGQVSRPVRPGAWSILCIAMAVSMPWFINVVAKQFGNGNGTEIIMLVSLGWGSLAFAILSTGLRTLSLSVVCSGFLTLFASFISDSAVSLWFALAWGILCLWWLVNNHWAQVETASAVRVQKARVQSIAFTIVGCLIFLAGAFSVADRIPVLRKLQTELMPTSGGTSGKDSAARRGVGNGDALVAARKHASSFGAVDTDLFLDSEQPSLFDVFSEEFGKPKIKTTRVERAQALTPQSSQSEDGKFTEGNRSTCSSEFSIERELPKDRRPVNDLVAESLMFWQGESGAHLAAQRFEQFDGVVWSNASTAVPRQTPTTIETFQLGEQCWFGTTASSLKTAAELSHSPFVDAVPEALKFTRYRSPIIPSRSGLQLWCIDQLDRADFFGISSDDCLHMPDREHVPDYTVVRMINSRIDLEKLEALVPNCSSGKWRKVVSDDCQTELHRLALTYAGELPRSWQQVQAVIVGLRAQFKLERVELERDRLEQKRELRLDQATAQPERSALNQFLTDRRGPDYMFATAAALMLEHLGYRTRLVVGFYADPAHYLARDGEISILPRDAHAWLEIDVGHGYWIPLEPSPGYRPPAYSASLWYKLKQHRAEIGLGFLATCSALLCVYWLRRWLVEWISWLACPVIGLLSHRLRIAWLTWLVDVRCQLAGVPRNKGTVLREHLNRFQATLPSDLAGPIQNYLESADRICFGGMRSLSKSDQAAMTRVWRGLTTQALQRSQRQMANSLQQAALPPAAGR